MERTAHDLELEKSWVERAQAGDRDALRKILERYGASLYRVILLPRLGDEARAKDALSDTYARVLGAIARYQWNAAGIWPWLRTIAVHVAIDALRARKRETPFDLDDLVREADAQADSSNGARATDVTYIEREEAARARKKVADALATIHPRYADAIRMRVLEERSREDVAKALGATPATFDVILHRAMNALRKAMEARTSTAESAPDSTREASERSDAHEPKKKTQVAR